VFAVNTALRSNVYQSRICHF